MKNVVILFLIVNGLMSCTEQSLVVDISESLSSLEYRHYEQDLFNINTKNIIKSLDELSTKYPVFINGDYKNPSKLLELRNYLNNELSIKLFKDWGTKIGSYDGIKQELNLAFSHYKHYFPSESLPVIYTYISGINHEEPIVVTDKEILIGIDLFYGKDYEVYNQLKVQKYISKNHQIIYLTPIVLRHFAQKKFSKYINGETLLENMIALGKIEYFIEATMPKMMDSVRFQFTSNQMIWCYSHEKSFWKHLATKNHLFSKDRRNYRRFIQHGPFVSSLERDSPGRAGIFLGYRIVKDYMVRNPDISLKELMENTDFTAIFKDSKYNP